ncbi:spermidine synthase [Actinotalea soli]|uniref:spermidine synthase n=1 Tax=Actinotalea soli TaxID=2819234 RepID=UPI0027DC551B|nr:fused MFS/spermidine synthase [Actinotalea soli]
MPDRRPRSRRGPRAVAAEPAALPEGPVPIDTGWVELVRDRSDPGAVTVLVNGVPSSHVELGDPTWLEFEYMQQMAAVVDVLPPGPLDAVHLGAGACSLPRWLDARRPGSRQIAVDVDAALLTLVRAWFDLPRSPRLRLRPGDARARLTELPDSSADLVVRDVFAGDRTPSDLGTREFVEEVARVLRPGGVYLANCADRPPLELARAEMATIRAVLPGAALVSEPGMLRGRRYGNLVLIGTRSGQGDLDLADPGLARTLRSLPVPTRLLRGPELDAFVGSAAPLADPPDPQTPPAVGSEHAP